MLPSRAEPRGRILDQCDHDYLRGAIANGRPPHCNLSVYGPCPSSVVLLDGVFLAARAGRLQESGVRFDPRLGFHLYDLDFAAPLKRRVSGSAFGRLPSPMPAAASRSIRRLGLRVWRSTWASGESDSHPSRLKNSAFSLWLCSFAHFDHGAMRQGDSWPP
jgi:hypothetical protein